MRTIKRKLLLASSIVVAIVLMFGSPAFAANQAGQWGTVTGDSMTTCSLSGPAGATSMCGFVGNQGVTEDAAPIVLGSLQPQTITDPSHTGATVYLASSQPNRSGIVGIDFFDSSGNLIGAAAVGGQWYNLPQSTWTTISGYVTVPSGAVKYCVIVIVAAGWNGVIAGSIPQGEAYAIQPV